MRCHEVCQWMKLALAVVVGRVRIAAEKFLVFLPRESRDRLFDGQTRQVWQVVATLFCMWQLTQKKKRTYVQL
jgi:hypothetical protein